MNKTFQEMHGIWYPRKNIVIIHKGAWRLEGEMWAWGERESKVVQSSLDAAEFLLTMNSPSGRSC